MLTVIMLPPGHTGFDIEHDSLSSPSLNFRIIVFSFKLKVCYKLFRLSLISILVKRGLPLKPPNFLLGFTPLTFGSKM